MALKLPSWVLLAGIGAGALYLLTKDKKDISAMTVGEIQVVGASVMKSPECVTCQTWIDKYGAQLAMIKPECQPCKQKMLAAIRAQGYTIPPDVI
ncbi:MAG: hypothetical protein JRD89_17265 [Deltaproteobacteria bacterium]|nr:hypothetical protein [Deltaproteobacteria bacterium]